MADYKISILVEGEDRASGPLRGVGGALGSLGTIAGGILTAGAIQQIGQSFTSMAQNAFDAYSKMEMSTLSMKSLITQELKKAGNPVGQMGNEIKGLTDDLQQWVKVLAVKSPFERQGVEDALRTAMAYSFTTKEAKRLTKGMADYGTVSGKTTAELAPIVKVMGQIRQTGRLLGQDAMQLTQAGIPLYDILAEKFGKTTAEIMKMQEKGLLPAVEVLEALFGYIEEFAGASDEAAGTLTGLSGALKDLKNYALIDLFGPSFMAIQPHLQGLVDYMLSPKGSAKFKQVGATIGGYVTGAMDFMVGLPDKVNTFTENLVSFLEKSLDDKKGRLTIGSKGIVDMFTDLNETQRPSNLVGLFQTLFTMIQEAWESSDKGPINIVSKGVVDMLLDWSELIGPKVSASFQVLMEQITTAANDPHTIAQAREAGRQIGLNIAWLGIGDDEVATRIGGAVLGFLITVVNFFLKLEANIASIGRSFAEGFSKGVSEFAATVWGPEWGTAINQGIYTALVMVNPILWKTELARIGRDIGTAIWNAAQATLDALGALFVSVIGRWSGFEGGGPGWSPKLNDDPVPTPGWRDAGSGARASGGSILPNRAYWVGEQGPELLFTGATSGYVMNNRQSMAMAGAGGGVNINLYVDQLASDIDVESLAQRLVRVIKQNQGI